MDETKPLMVSSSPGSNGKHVYGLDNGGGNSRNKPEVVSPKWIGVGVVATLAVFSVGMWFGRSTRGHPVSSVLSPPPPNPANDNTDDNEHSSSSMRYRPFCMVHGNRVAFAGILQTSMGNPSQQWSHIPCYAQPERVRTWAATNNVGVNINGFGAPDAILRTNFSHVAFPQRPTIVGFGGAFTEAASLNYQSLSTAGKERLMELLFGKTGLGYSVGRVHINSCDFSVQSYSFDETDGDFDLVDFDTNVTHDAQKDGMIDMVLKATAVFREAWGAQSEGSNVNDDGDFKLFASPWSPPSWMKAPWSEEDIEARKTYASGMTGSLQPSCLREGTVKGSRYAKAWALYFSKFISAYLSYGVPLKAVTVQNEPEFPAPWEACSYSPKAEADFVGYHLGPQLEKDHPDIRIIMFDHNKDHMVTWAKTLLDPKRPSSKYITGTAYHWYAGGMDRLLDGAVGSPNMHRMQEEMKKLNVSDDHLIFNSEACHCPYTGYAGGDIENYWARAERYAHTILADLAAGSNGWVEWNLVLDSVGGPNHLKNLCDTTILAVPHRAINGSGIPPIMDWETANASGRFGPNHGNERTREELNALGFPAVHLDAGLAVQPMYYYMGHISRYVRPGSRPVMGLVDNANDGFRAFRSPGQVVAGGGLNDLARHGIELTAWPCEGSTRQQFQWTDKKHIVVSGHDWLGNPTRSCLASKADESFEGITLSDCTNKNEIASFDIVNATKNETSGYVKFIQIDKTGPLEHCLILKKLGNKGGAYGPRGGPQVTYGSCDSTAALWRYSEMFGEIISDNLPEGPVCMTTGWPFLQIGAFETPNGESKKTVVILNEARDAANYVLYDNDDPVLSGSIPPRSIQTLLMD
ncbi:O-glycosyl hydrolase family protein [Nitzschia inconspicua]|uniref:O-glycosyl hydrolase family protein n=1 Tax=Nitzschia inconspicua TaxID=303405 RepID=A0A9K3LRF9_9STRA|nr:O-glycosyl hydrolase family protein [Nitzschia inconspicua]